MTDYELGYQHGYSDNRARPGVNKYPNNFNYCAGFNDGDWARVYKPSNQESEE